ncbi:hypothetical protein [Thiomicrorhabdus sp. 6S3-12]|uniref:hypothetical protein n=1 Tax=Thiomicrorhabdus sp. 6S3-12 TaxID=2819681 RepID=UPI001AAD5E16|nr:hypothetical protein [Thiomicrorhabdus sp. 6S3-12]MBO1924209.1 hypothetical protein [Thiomicrorhabdus sp. 6S3-12]
MSDQNNQVDDLLEAVEELDLAGGNLEQKVDQSQKTHKELHTLSEEAKVDSSIMTLEAAKTAQEAATQSQEAAKASLQVSEALRGHTEELTNATFNWRQAIRHASQEMAESKKLFVSMLVISLLLSLTAVGVMIAVYYNIGSQQEQLKGEILDVVQTENALFTKKMTIKIDDLASQIEASRFYVEKLARSPQPPVDITTEESTSQEETTTPEVNNNPKTIQTAEQSPEQSKIPATVNNSAEIEQLLQAQLQPMQDKMTQQISQLSEQQATLSKELQKLAIAASKQPKPVMTSGGTARLDAKQSQQLADIRWLVSKHDKKLLTISDQLKTMTQPDAQSDIKWQKQLEQLQLQQKTIQTELQKLQENVKELTSKVNANQPYSYKAK